MERLDSVIAICPNIEKYPELYYYRGMNAFDTDNFALGIYELNRVKEHVTDFDFKYEILNNLGILYAIQEDFKLAGETFKQSYDLAIENNDADKADYSYQSLMILELDNGNAAYLQIYEEYFLKKDFKGDRCAQIHTLAFLSDYYRVFEDFDKANRLIEENFDGNYNYGKCAMDLMFIYGIKAEAALLKKEYAKSLIILDSIPHDQLLAIDKLTTYKFYKEAHAGLNNEELVKIYTDSIVDTLKKNKQENNAINSKILSDLDSNEINFRDKISSLTLYLMIGIVILLIAIFLLWYYIRSKRKTQVESDYHKENYNMLWGNYQLSRNKLEVLKKELITQRPVENSTHYNNLINDINAHLDASADDPHRHLNMAENQFIIALKSRASYLSEKELNVCFFFKLNLSHRKIAEILNKTEKSIDAYKYRINKKVLKHEQIQLMELLQKIDY